MIILPNQTDKIEIEKDTRNKTIFPLYEILVFLIPYVIPMPRESILLESARISELINIKTPPEISYVEKRILLSQMIDMILKLLQIYHKPSTSHIKFSELSYY